MTHCKIVTLSVVCGILYATAFAADTDGGALNDIPSKLYLNTSAGINLAGMSGSEVDLEGEDSRVIPRISGNAAIFIGYKPLQWLAVEGGAGVVGKGVSFLTPLEEYDADLRIEHHDIFIEVPVILKPAVRVPFDISLYGMTGLSFGKQCAAYYSAHVDYTDLYGAAKAEEVNSVNLMREGLAVPVDNRGGEIIIPYADVYRAMDLSLILGTGLEFNRSATRGSNSFTLELTYFAGLLNQSRLTPAGERMMNEASEKLLQFMIDNHLTAAQAGIDNAGVKLRNPGRYYHTVLFSMAYRHYF